MIWLLPAAGCSIVIALILKVNEERGGDRLVLAGANYIVAAVVSLGLLRGRMPVPGSYALSLGAAAGVDYVLGFLLLMAGIARGPLAVPVTVMRLSVAVPVAASVLVWSEHPGAFQWAGCALGLAAILLFGLGIQHSGSGSRPTGNYWMLIVSLFAVMGTGDLLLKAFRETSPQADMLPFTLILFSVAALFTWIVILLRRVTFDPATFLLGLLLGVPNLFSTVFMLTALRTTAASIAFPFVNLTVIMGSAVFGYLLWRERLSRLGIVGLILAAIAVVLLPAR